MAAGVYSPEAVLGQGWDNLVVLLDQGGYTRYDFKTATKLLKIMESLQARYQGSLERLHAAAADPDDLERRLRELAPGIGPATVNIFLRELRGIWAKADPPLSPLAQAAAEHSGLMDSGPRSTGGLKRAATPLAGPTRGRLRPRRPGGGAGAPGPGAAAQGPENLGGRG